MIADKHDSYDRKYDSAVQENPYELQAAMEQQLRLEQNGSMEHAVILLLLLLTLTLLFLLLCYSSDYFTR